jgi:hypothetical protein
MGSWIELDGGSRCAVRGSTENVDMYAGEWLAQMPFSFHVLGCQELRDAVEAVGRRMLAASASASPLP